VSAAPPSGVDGHRLGGGDGLPADALIFFDLFLTMEIGLPVEFFSDQEASPEFMYSHLTTVTNLGGPSKPARIWGVS
jgi:hypothetical protein